MAAPLNQRPDINVVITRQADNSRNRVERYIPDVPGAVTLDYAFGQAIDSGTVQFRDIPFEPLIKDLIEIWMGYDGNLQPVFTGLVTNPGRQGFPKGWNVQFANILQIADFPVEQSKGTIVYDDAGDPVAVNYDAIVLLNTVTNTPNSITANEAITRLLRDWAGIPAFRIQVPPLQDFVGHLWVLGKLHPVAWSGGSPLQACMQICDALGFWLYCDYSGYVRAVYMSGAPGDLVYHPPGEARYEEGKNIFINGESLDSNVNQVYNEVVVTGANTLEVPAQDGSGIASVYPVTDSWRVDTPWLPAGKSRVFSYSNDLIEYVNEADGGSASCTAVAKRQLAEHSRLPRTISATIKGDPKLTVGATVELLAPRIGVDPAEKFFVYGISASFGGGTYTMGIRLDGGANTTTGITLSPPPVASFSFLVIQETRNGVDEVEVFCFGSGSPPGGGSITSYTWSAVGGTPAAGTTQNWVTRFPATTTTITITLVVTATNGKESEPFSQVIHVGQGLGVPKVRKLSVAMGNTWYVTPNGGQEWRSESGTPSVAVPPIGAGGDEHATLTDAQAGLLTTGGADGHRIRSTLDLLATASTLLGTLPAEPLFLWQNERTPSRVWAAVGSDIYFSANSGTTWVKANTGALPHPVGDTDTTVRWVVESADTNNVIDVLAGRCMFTSFDGGKTWGGAAQLIGPAGSIAKCYVSGQGRHWVGFINCPAGSSAARSVEGDSVTWAVSTTPAVTDVRAITMMVETPDLYLFDAQGRIWRANVLDGTNVSLWGSVPT